MKYLTTQEFADLIHVKHQTVRRWRFKHKGPAYIKVGSKVIYSEKDIENWLDARCFK